jgi:hypothetical protein
MFHAVLDPYYLAITALVTIGWQAAGFAIAFGLQIDTITDFWSATNFGFLALLTLNLGAAYEARNIVATIFVLLWAVRLGGWQLFRLLQSECLRPVAIQWRHCSPWHSQWDRTRASMRCAPSRFPLRSSGLRRRSGCGLSLVSAFSDLRRTQSSAKQRTHFKRCSIYRLVHC